VSTTAVGLDSCLNCGAPLTGHFCAHCGQKAEATNPTVREFGHELLHEIAHVDGKIVQSTIRLLTRPGVLTREHFEGRRARYVSPIRLYLVFSVLFFAVTAISPLKGGHIGCSGCNAEQQQQMRETIAHWTPRAMFVLVPVFAGLVALVARGSGRNYPQHLYFSMHVHSAWFVAAAIAGASNLLRVDWIGQAAAGAALVYGLWYLVVALRRAYGVSWLRASVGTVLVVAVYWIIVLVTILAIAIPALRTSRAS